MEKMNSKYYVFYRENDNFDDILKDSNIKNVIHFKIKWQYHLMIGIMEKGNDRHFSYIGLKYGDDLKRLDTKDRTPIPGVDYVPKKDKNRFKKSID
jgi:hypothetical protein